MPSSRRPLRPTHPGESRARRRAEGKALRQRVGRSRHGEWAPPKDRPDPLATLAESDRHRRPDLLPIRYGRMLGSPFAFFRGAAGVMARDLAGTPATGITVQLAGDAHVGNFGLFATPERRLVFDANDFDETLPGPWEWDVKRLATSLVLAGRQNGFPPETVRGAATSAVRTYRERTVAFGTMRYLDVWYSRIDPERDGLPLSKRGRWLVGHEAQRAERRTGLHAFPKIAHAVRGGYRIRDDPPLIVHYEDPGRSAQSGALFDRYLDSLPEDRRVLLGRYRLVDVVQKVVGVGSVGSDCSVLLLLADDDVEDPLLLQLKEAGPSVLEPYAGPSAYANHAQRVVVGQHLIQEASDLFLGFSRLRGRDFYVRQLRDMKFAYDVSELGPKSFTALGQLCAVALARAHARTGDAARVGGYLGSGEGFDLAVTRFAEAYAEQTVADHRRLVAAVARSRIAARSEV